MALEIELTVPRMHVAIRLFQPLLQVSEELIDPSGLDPGKPGHSFQPPAKLQHLPGHTASSIAVSVGQEQLPIDVLVPVFVPDALDHRGFDHTVVGVPEPASGRSGDEMGENFTSVDPPPPEGVMGHAVVLVPAYLGGEKVLDPGLLEDLRQGPAVSKDIGKPEVGALDAKLPPKETRPEQQLSYERLPGGHVAVRFKPHGSLRLPASLLNAIPDLIVNLRIIALQILVQLRLGLEKDVFRVAFHHAKSRGKGAGHFLAGMAQAPEPGHIDVGMPDAPHHHRMIAPYLRKPLPEPI